MSETDDETDPYWLAMRAEAIRLAKEVLDGNVPTYPFDAADYIMNEEAAAVFMEDALESGDAAVIEDARETIERARRKWVK